MGDMSPCGLAFFAAAAHNGRQRLLPIAFWAVAGILSTGRWAETGLYMCAFFLYYHFSGRITRLQHRLWSVPLFMFSIIVLVKSVTALWLDGTLYHVVLALLEGALCLVLAGVFRYSFSIFTTKQQAAPEAQMSAVLVVALAVAGIGDWAVAGYSVRNVMGSLVVVLLALIGGTGLGAAAGVAVGMVMGLSNGNAAAAIAYYAIAGTVAGALHNLGKFAVAAGFLLGGSITVMFLEYHHDQLRILAETAVATAVSMAASPMRMAAWRERCVRGAGEMVSHDDRLCHASEKIDHLALMFQDLSAAFLHMSDGVQNKLREEELSMLMATVGRQVCDICRRRTICWEKNFYQTYQAMVDNFAIAATGGLDGRSLTPLLKEVCLNREQLVATINLVADRSRHDQYWQRKVSDVRRMVAEQLRATGSIMTNLSREIKKEPDRNDNLAAIIQQRCAAVNCSVSNVQVRNENTGPVIHLVKWPCDRTKECANTILPLTADLVQEKVHMQAQCGSATKIRPCEIVLHSAQRFQLLTGAAFSAKDQQISGDTYSVTKLNNGKMALMLSDGMGCGSGAASDSGMTVRFLERLLTAGFDVDVAVKTVNSLLMLRTTEETFATVDMAIINMYTGETEFLKIGSAPSFIKRVREVTPIESASLPIGILHHVEIEPVRVTLAGGDIIVMVSDGVADVNHKASGQENWIVNFLRRADSVNSQDIADCLLKQAQSMAGEKRRDDMTVLVARLVEQTAVVH